MLFLFLHFISYIPDRNLIFFLELTYVKSFYLKSQEAICLFMLLKVNSISKKKKTNKNCYHSTNTNVNIEYYFPP